MNKIMDIDKAISLIKDGDTIWVNAFLAISNPVELNSALTERYVNSGHPKNLKLYCSAGFGDWTEGSACEGYIKAGAVDMVVLGHFTSMPDTSKKILANEIEAYNLPLGVMSHMIRAAASKKSYLRTKIGINLFTDPRIHKYGMNKRSTTELVKLSLEDNEEVLEYKVPKIDIAIIKGSSADLYGNISFEDECATIDALSTAQAAKINGGKVLVQVSRVINKHQRPRDVIVPGMMVDAIVVCEEQKQLANVAGYNASLSGDIYVRENEMNIWAKVLEENMRKSSRERPFIHRVIANRAFRELREGNVVNIGIGIPEFVASAALREGMLSKIFLTVESGSIGGLPATGKAFGSAIGADIIMDMAQQFDFYDGGGLDICFIGALEADSKGNVNGHCGEGKLTGIGGFANITQNSRKVVFCLTFSTNGVNASIDEAGLHIVSEGAIPKFVETVENISFSAKNAIKNGQEILYVTERAVFRLTESGLELIEAAEGINVEEDIVRKLPFEIKISSEFKRFKPIE